MDIGKSEHLEWMYPNIYDKEPLDKLTVSLYHTRAANSFTIEFHSERNGFVIRMDKTKDTESGCETVEKDVEVAFIPAWLEDDDA